VDIRGQERYSPERNYGGNAESTSKTEDLLLRKLSPALEEFMLEKLAEYQLRNSEQQVRKYQWNLFFY